jgi:hypothetical protein
MSRRCGQAIHVLAWGSNSAGRRIFNCCAGHSMAFIKLSIHASNSLLIGKGRRTTEKGSCFQ